MTEFSVYIGLDVHKATIAVAIAPAGRGQPYYHGEIANTPTAIKRLLHKLSPDGEVLGICYEAGPCGYSLHRQITSMGHDCIVVSPGPVAAWGCDTGARDPIARAPTAKLNA